MKRGLIIIIFLLIIPLALASPPPSPYIVDEEGNAITQVYYSSGLGVPRVEDYTSDGCPVVFQKNAAGKRQAFLAKLNAEGTFDKTSYTPKDITTINKDAAGITCGINNIRTLRPIAPIRTGKWVTNKTNLERLSANAELNIGIKKKPDGTTTYFNTQLKEAIASGEIKPPRLPKPKPNIITSNAILNAESTQQEIAVVVIPVEFPDQEASKSISNIENQFFGESGFAGYYNEQSYGNLRITGNVARSWYLMQNEMGYYGDNYEANIEELITEAILAADDEIDYSLYDYNKDGIVDGLFVVHAGEPDENGGGNGEDIWSHYYSISPITVDGVRIIDYETVSEDSPTGIIAHEFGHYLGLPDMYDTDPDDGLSKGVGEWSLMGYGAYLDPLGSLDPWSKIYMNWLDDQSLQEISANDYYEIATSDSSTNIKYYKIPVTDNEYYLIENVPETELMNGDDASGILIWHIDESVIDETGSWSGCRGTRWDCNTVDGDASHKLTDVEEADGTEDLDSGDFGSSSDLWYYKCSSFGGCQQNIFDSLSTPQAISYDGSTTIYIGVYDSPSSLMELGLSTDGTPLEAPAMISEETTEAAEETKSSSNLWIIIIIIIVTIIIVTTTSIIIYKIKTSSNY